MSASVLFLTLRTFSATGGIEKVCRVAGKALANQLPAGALRVHSMYDQSSEVQASYIPAESFLGFGQRRAAFILQSFLVGRKSKLVILSHINLMPVALLLTLFAPRVKLVLFAHGIEVWRPIAAWKRWVLRRCWRVLAVSAYTRSVIIPQYGLNQDRVDILHNALDPWLPAPVQGPKSADLLARYGFDAASFIFLTLTRIAATEGYKGYDLVLQALAQLLPTYPHLRYLLVGKYDAVEKARLDALIQQLGISNYVVFAGFVPDEALAHHFHLADSYIMPSQKEGFGIVFIEALYYGKAVIAGNKDGSVDALGGGRFGTLINPDSVDAVREAMEQHLTHQTKAFQPSDIQEAFGFDTYQQKWASLLQQL